MMPDMSGFEVLFRIRAQEAYARIPVVVLTGVDLDTTDVELLRKTAKAVLLKGQPWKTYLLEELRQVAPPGAAQ
jgi:CheY-like chemotaxis protein